jgi:hypothetical protein
MLTDNSERSLRRRPARGNHGAQIHRPPEDLSTRSSSIHHLIRHHSLRHPQSRVPWLTVAFPLSCSLFSSHTASSHPGSRAIRSQDTIPAFKRRLLLFHVCTPTLLCTTIVSSILHSLRGRVA